MASRVHFPHFQKESRMSQATRRLVCSCVLVAFSALCAASAGAQERCGVARDFMVQGLERIKTASNSEVADGLQLLKHANEVCTSLGDAWYYRSVFERRLNQT